MASTARWSLAGAAAIALMLLAMHWRPDAQPSQEQAPQQATKPVTHDTPLKAYPLPEPPPSVTKAVEPHSAPSLPSPQQSTPDNIERGRALLKQMEAGERPLPVIRWPASAGKRDRIHAYFERHGVVVAVMDDERRIWRLSDPYGHAWTVPLDRYSGFIRLIGDSASDEEQRTMQRIRRRHGLPASAVGIRVVPRELDASLLASISDAHETLLVYRVYGHKIKLRLK